jgi:hypothetical protein
MLPIIAVMNLIVGTLVGISGIAGFLLPIVFTGYLGMDLSLSLALSFISFLTSGIIGSYRYQRQGQLDIKFGVLIGIGSIIGGIVGVQLNFMIPLSTAKLFLYVVVLASGISILLKKDKPENSGEQTGSLADSKGLLGNKVFVVLLGFITGAICSLSGAGGPVLVMPILVTLGMPVRVAVAVSLFDSIFIALPAVIGYLGNSPKEGLLVMCAVSIICQAIGVFFGTGQANRINVRILKKAVAVFSIGIAIYMIIGLV